ncbi:MAG: hypothetical protein RL390_975, partial [Actinomycetota bacterium]
GATEFKDVRVQYSDAPIENVWACIERIGGENGWYGSDWLWYLRGLLDRIFGGVGLRRGRRDPYKLRVGDSLDFWRVEEYEEGKKLRLYAEMILPGKAWLEFTLEEENGRQLSNHEDLVANFIGGEYLLSIHCYSLRCYEIFAK